MNRLISFLFGGIVFLASMSQANEIQIFIPGTQTRYENDEDQSIRNRQYDNYNLAVGLDKYVIGGEFNTKESESTSGAIKLVTKYQEANLYAGYTIFSHVLHEAYKISVDTAPLIYLGRNRATVETIVGTASTLSVGEDNYNLALGAQANVRLNFFIFQADLRYAYSRSFEPSSIPIYGFRIGFRIGL